MVDPAHRRRRPSPSVLRFAATQAVPRLPGPRRKSRRRCGRSWPVHRGRAVRFAAARPGRCLADGMSFSWSTPKAVPSRLAWEAGVAMADSLLSRYRDDYGRWPQSVGLSVWGTSAMRTAGDDIAEVLALLGVRPIWDDASRRVVEPGTDPAGRTGPAPHRRDRAHLRVFPRRVPHVVTMLDDAVQLAANLDEPAADNYVRPTRKPTSPNTVTSVGPPQGFSARSRAATARACCS